MRRKLAAIALAIGVITVFAGSALAGHLAGGVTSYTGCLVSKDGVIIKIKAGESPSSPCSGGMVQVHFSGGDITKISVTGALTGGGDNGEVTIGLKPEFTLPTGCANGAIAEWSGSAWVCGIDNDTTYSAGTGLDLSAGNAFSIEPNHRVKNTPDCSSGQFATGFASDGVIACAVPPAALPEVTFRDTRGDAPEGHENEITSFFLLAGNYLINVAGTAIDDLDGNDEVDVTCYLYAGEVMLKSVSASAEGAGVGVGLHAESTLAITYVAKLTATTKLRITCRSSSGSDHVEIAITALKVGAVS